jgi:hypothetical protein
MTAGRPPFQPTKEQSLIVSVMATCGASQEMICARILNSHDAPIDRVTLRKYFKRELKYGKADANAAVAQSLFRKSTGNGPQSVTAAIFWLKCQALWKENQISEITIGYGSFPIMTLEKFYGGLLSQSPSNDGAQET